MTNRLVLLCHANVSRSPSAELIARALAGTSTAWEFSSAGTHAPVGRHIDPTMGDSLRSRGIATWSHRARQADEALLRSADVILAFESRQRDWVAQHYPARLRATTTIRRAAALLGAMPAGDDPSVLLAADASPFHDPDDFSDPIGKGHEAASAAVQEIDALLRVILPAIGAVSASSLPPTTTLRATRMGRRRSPAAVGDPQRV